MRASIMALVLLLSGPGLAGDLVLVAGATGGTGREVVAELLKAGYEVRALVRDPEAARSVLGDRIGYTTGDVRQRATLDAALKDVRYLVTAIGASRRDPANGPEFVDFEGVRNLAGAAAAAGVAHHVLVSSAGVTREDHILNRLFDNVLVWKAKGEAAVRSSGVPYTIVRPGGLTNQAGGRAGIRLEQGDSGTGYIPRADVARICVAALKAPAARNRTFEAYSANTGPDVDWDATFSQLAADGATP